MGSTVLKIDNISESKLEVIGICCSRLIDMIKKYKEEYSLKYIFELVMSYKFTIKD